MAGDGIGIGVVGCGDVSTVYLDNLRKARGPFHLEACADIHPERAAKAATAQGIRPLSIEELLGDERIGLIVNLTPPLSHAALSLAALSAGKHVYSEKPLAPTLAEAEVLAAEARSRGLRLGGAPDTFMGGGLQLAARLIAEGAIGEVVGGTVQLLGPGPEAWHPTPWKFYARGAGPVLDRGPYAVAALVELLGPVESLWATDRRMGEFRETGAGPDAGRPFSVEVPTFATAILRFGSGALVSTTLSYDVSMARCPRFELWGIGGSLGIPDPLRYGGPVSLARKGGSGWEELAVDPFWSGNLRGLGVVDMARAIAEGRPHRASLETCLHVLAVLEAILKSAQQGGVVRIGGRGASTDV